MAKFVNLIKTKERLQEINNFIYDRFRGNSIMEDYNIEYKLQKSINDINDTLSIIKELSERVAYLEETTQRMKEENQRIQNSIPDKNIENVLYHQILNAFRKVLYSGHFLNRSDRKEIESIIESISSKNNILDKEFEEKVNKIKRLKF